MPPHALTVKPENSPARSVTRSAVRAQLPPSRLSSLHHAQIVPSVLSPQQGRAAALHVLWAPLAPPLDPVRPFVRPARQVMLAAVEQPIPVVRLGPTPTMGPLFAASAVEAHFLPTQPPFAPPV